MLEENNLQSENWDYIDQGRRLRGENPGLKFKLNAYAIPCRDELWEEVYHRINRFVHKPCVFDWNVPCFREDLKFKYEYKCKTFFYEKPKRVCDPPEKTLYEKCVPVAPNVTGVRVGMVSKIMNMDFCKKKPKCPRKTKKHFPSNAKVSERQTLEDKLNEQLDSLDPGVDTEMVRVE